MNIGGIKTLISSNYYSESDFWKIWNKENYDKVKGKTDPIIASSSMLIMVLSTGLPLVFM